MESLKIQVSGNLYFSGKEYWGLYYWNGASMEHEESDLPI